MTAGGAALLAAALACLCWSSWRWAAGTGLERATDVLVAWGVLLLGTIVGTVLVLGGLLHALDAVPLAAAAGGTAALAGATTATHDRRLRVAAARRALRAAPAVVWAALRSPFVLVLALAATAAVGYRVAIAVAFPALDWDGLGYHLPMADYWLQERRLLTNPFSSWAQMYPGAAESVVTWIGGLTGTVRAAAAVQIGAAALGAVSIVALSRGAGCTARSSLVGGLLFLLAPLVLTQLSTAEVDIAAAATLLACWHLLLVALRRDGSHSVPPTAPPAPATPPPEAALAGSGGLALAAPPAVTASPMTADHPAAATGRGVLPVLVIAGIGAGVAAGVKVTNLFAVAVLGVVLVGTVLWRGWVSDRRPGSVVARAVVRAACFGLPAAALAGAWYVRNALVWGNPLYPLAVAGLPGNPDIVAAAGVDPRQVGTTHPAWAVLASWASDLHWRTYYYGSPIGGLGGAWLLVMVPAVLVAFVLLLFLRGRHRLTAWGLLAPGAVLLAAYPGQYHARYTLFLLGLGGVGLAVVLDLLPRALRSALLAVVTAAAIFSASAASWQALDLSGDFTTGPTPGAVLALMRAPAHERADAGLRGAFIDVDRAEPGSTILVPPEYGDFGQPWVLSHSLWEDDLRRRVVEAAGPIEDADSALRALAAADAQYVVVTKDSPLEAALLAGPQQLHVAFDVGWLARAWAPGPGPR